MTVEPQSEAQVAELHTAFRVFTEATENLEREYRRLQMHAGELREELAAKNRELRISRERQRALELQALRQSRLAAMGEMAATLAHEVRNPLGAMELFTRMLMDEVGSQDSAKRLADQIARGITDLNHLVSNILDFTRLPEPHLASIDVWSVVDDALRHAAGALAADVRVERLGASPSLWSVDRGLLVQALANLLRNAAEAMSGVGTIRVALEPAEECLRLLVSDTGSGVAPGDEEAIFTPFFTTKARGTGLGLAVARAAVVAHGGTLVLDSSGPGATFVVTLPAAQPGQRAVTSAGGKSHGSNPRRR